MRSKNTNRLDNQSSPDKMKILATRKYRGESRQYDEITHSDGG